MEEYKKRMAEEYRQVKERYDKLYRLLVMHDAGTLTFTPTCPIQLLRDQADVMAEYLYILEVRAEIESVCLDLKPGPLDQ